MTIAAERRRERGYARARQPQLNVELSKLDRTNALVSVAHAGVYLAQLWLVPLTVWWLAAQGWSFYPLAVLSGGLALLWQASRLRALENLVHDGAHLNWSRRNKPLNDVLVDILAAAPVMQVVQLYRAAHGFHHGGFGSALDPCMKRAVMKGEITRGNPLSVRVVAALEILPELAFEYYRSQFTGTKQGPLRFVLWHLLVVLVPYSLLLGAPAAVLLWITFWGIPFIVVLPLVRALAESEEHDYDKEGGELQATFTNDGPIWRTLVHPAGDAWHAAHHVRMTVPAWKVKRLHRNLAQHMPEYRATLD